MTELVVYALLGLAVFAAARLAAVPGGTDGCLASCLVALVALPVVGIVASLGVLTGSPLRIAAAAVLLWAVLAGFASGGRR